MQLASQYESLLIQPALQFIKAPRLFFSLLIVFYKLEQEEALS